MKKTIWGGTVSTPANHTTKPAATATATATVQRSSQAASPAFRSQPTPTEAPASRSRPPELDLEALCEEVLDRLRRDLLIERERIGGVGFGFH